MDRRLRDLERRAAAGDHDATLALVRARVRAGELSRDGLRLAAYLDDGFSQEALGTEAPARSRHFARWGRGLKRWGETVCGQALIAIAPLLPGSTVAGRSYLHDPWFMNWIEDVLPVAALFLEDSERDGRLMRELLDRFLAEFDPGFQYDFYGPAPAALTWRFVGKRVKTGGPKVIHHAIAFGLEGILVGSVAKRIGPVCRELGRLRGEEVVERTLREALLPLALDPAFSIDQHR